MNPLKRNPLIVFLGKRVVFNGVEGFAIPEKKNVKCPQCVFPQGQCAAIPCLEHIYVPLIKYITHRITS